jgi:U3 small nucleolar RNA-associated protein 14
MAGSGRTARTARTGRAPAAAVRRKSNATAGFAKRQAKKAKGPAFDDVYEFQQPKQRRSRATVDTRLGREEAAEFSFGRGDGSDEDAERKELRARLIGEQDDDEGLGSDEDEEIDSDAAFEEEDEDRYAGFNFPSVKVRLSAHHLPLVQV